MYFLNFLKELGALTPLVPTVTDILTSSSKRKDEGRKVFAKAIDETTYYFAEYGRTFSIDRKRMKELVELWRSAAIALKRVDKELAEICDRKAEYWIDPTQYSPDDRTSIQLQLDYLRDRYKEL